MFVCLFFCCKNCFQQKMNGVHLVVVVVILQQQEQQRNDSATRSIFFLCSQSIRFAAAAAVNLLWLIAHAEAPAAASGADVRRRFRQRRHYQATPSFLDASASSTSLCQADAPAKRKDNNNKLSSL